MSARSNILTRIKTGLQSPAARPAFVREGKLFKEIDPAEYVTRFEKELTALKGEFKCARNWEEAQGWIKSLVCNNEIQNVTVAPEPDALQAAGSIRFRVTRNDQDYGSALKLTDMAITPCSFLVAQTGSVLLTALSGYGRAFSVLPHAHLVVARKSQLIGTLREGYSLLKSRYGHRWPSMITIITGPSRTADIEKILVLGAHGPKRLFVLLLDF